MLMVSGECLRVMSSPLFDAFLGSPAGYQGSWGAAEEVADMFAALFPNA